MKKNKYIDNNIDILNLDSKLESSLKENNITTIKELWELNRKKLKDMGYKDNDINQIIIRMQLLGLDLNRRIYN